MPALTQRTCLLACLLVAALAAAGSTTPFDFRAIPPSAAFDLFARMRFAPLGRLSGTDILGNIMLFAPLGFFLGGALDNRRVCRPSSRVTLAVDALCIAALLSAALEFTQIFVPSRYVAGSDILAEVVGAALGVAAWLGAGRRLAAFIDRRLADREPAGPVVWGLAVYALVFFVVQIYPFDVTISPPELAAKYREGRIAWRTTGFPVPLVLAGAPLGALAVMGWPPAGRRRHPAQAIALAVGIIGLTLSAQLFIYSRPTHGQDLVALCAGAAAGAASRARRAPTSPSSAL